MGFWNDRLSSLIQSVSDMNTSFVTMSANFKNLEISYEKFVQSTEKKIDKISDENEDIRRRITSIEGTIDSTFKVSTKEALQNVFKEYLNENGKLPSDISDGKKLIEEKPTSE